MPENFGGLDYAINVVGDWESRLADFNAQVDAIDKKSKAAAARVGTTAKSGEGTNGALDREAVIRKKLLALEKQSIVAGSSRVQLSQKDLELATRRTAKERSNLATQKRSTQALKERQQVAKFLHDQEVRRAAKSEASAKKEIARRNDLRKSQQAYLNTLKAQHQTEKAINAELAQRAKAMDGASAVAEKGRLAGQRASDKEQATLRGNAEKSERAQRKAAEFNNLSLQATQRNNAATRELAIKHQQINQLMREQGISMRSAADQIGISSAQAKQLKLNMFDVSHAARQFLFTFRRLVGILAIFTVARKLAQALGSAVNEMSRFNAELETAQIGIAGIVSSVGKVVDLQGNLVTGADAFAASMDASRAILGQLKKDAIGSIATFEALVKSYQVAIGPGLAAGLDLEQIRVLSKRLAEGAITLGVPLNQLSEEIRSLLQGTATARNTRIAVLFGGAKEANEAIRNAKEQGNLYEVLTEKLAGVAMASDAASMSFNVLKSDLQDAIQILLAQGGVDYFNQLKESLVGLRGALTQSDPTGGIIFKPEALGLVQEIASALADVTASFRDVTDTGQVLVFLRNAMASLGDVLKTIAPLVSGIFQGLITGANLALAPVRILIDAVRGVARAFGFQTANKELAKIIKFLVAGATALLIWRKIFLSIPVLLGKMAHILAVIGAKFAQIVIAQALTQAQMLGITVGTAAWDVLLAGVVLKMALITGGVTLILGALAFLVTKTRLFENLIGDVNRSLDDGSKSADELTHAIISAGDATAEGAKSAKDWADEIRKLQRELVKAKGLSGLTGSAEEVAELFQEAVKELDRGTVQWRLQEEASKEQLSNLEKQLKVLEEQERQLKANGQAQTDAFGILLDSDITGFGGLGPSGAGANALKENKVSIAKVAILAQQKVLEENIAEARENQLKALDLQIKAYQAENTLRQQGLEEQNKVATAELALTEILTERANESVKDLAVLQAKGKLLNAEISQERELRSLSLETAQRNLELAEDLGAEQSTLLQLEIELAKIKAENGRLDEIAANRVRQMTEDIERQKKLLSGDFFAGLKEGLHDFSQELPALGEQIADIVSGALSDLAGTVADVFKDAIDPRKDADIATAFGEFFLDLAGQFAEAITSQLIQGALLKLGLGAQEDIAVNQNTLAIQQLTLATQANTTATQTAAGPAGAQGPALPPAPSGGASPAAGATDAATKSGGFFAGLLSNPLLWAIFIPILISMLAQAFKKGGQVKGYAEGGTIGGMPRPSNIPSSDTVPAWLTPGEFVIKKESVKKYGAGLLSAINAGVVNPHSFSNAAFAMGGLAKNVQHFASGGAVQRASSGVGKAGGTQTIVLPVIPATEDNMEQLITGGRSSFNQNINKAPFIGDPNRSGGM